MEKTKKMKKNKNIYANPLFWLGATMLSLAITCGMLGVLYVTQ